MALVEDLLTENAGLVVAVGAASFVVPAVAPHLSPPLRSALKAGLSLFLDAESDAEGNIIKGLAEDAVHHAMKALSGPGSTAQRHEAARQALRHFSHRARRRADRYGRDQQDTHARYRRHMHGLHQALEKRKGGADRSKVQDLERIMGGL